MKTWQIVLLGLAAASIAGCKTDPNQALLERDLRRQENEIYRLRDQLEDCQAELDAARRCSTAARGGPSATSSPERPETGEPAPPDVQMSDQPPLKGKDSERLATPPGRPDAPPPSPKAPAAPNLEAPPSPFKSSSRPLDGREFSVAGRDADSALVRQITFNQSLTGGYVAEENPGEQGLLVVIEPRDGQGRLLAAPADVQVAVLDPKLSGQEARVARWNLTAAETAAQLRGGADSGIHLTLPWRNNRPKHAKLHLFVRYVTGDGRKVEADQPIEVVLPSDRAAGWAPAPQGASNWSAADAAATRTADRSSDDAPRRPTWSPERQ